MRRVLIISLIALGAIAGLVLLCAGAFFYTTPGRNLAANLIESTLADELGGEVDIGVLSGAPPQRLVLDTVVFSENGAPWLVVDHLELDWRPLLLLRNRIDIDRAAIRDARLIAPPPKGPPKTEPPRALALPDDLPHIRIGDLRVDNFAVDAALAGRSRRLDGAGRLSMGGRVFSAIVRAKSEDLLDAVDAVLEVDPIGDRLIADISVASAADGLIAMMADADGPVRISLKADAPLSDGRASLVAGIGGYGRIEGAILCNLLDAKTAEIDAVIRPGEQLQDVVDEIGTEARIEARFEQKAGGAKATLLSFAGAFGELMGDIEWSNRRRALDRLSLSLNANFAETYRPAEQAWLGGAATLTANFVRRQSDYELDAQFVSTLATIALSGGRTDLRHRLSGNLLAAFEPRQAAPAPLKNGATINAALTLEGKKTLALNGLALTIGDAELFAGDAAFDRIEKKISIEGAATFAPNVIASIAPSVEVSKPVLAQINLSGPLDRLTLAAEIDAPQARIGERTVPAASVEASLAGLPRLPTGEIKGGAVNGSGQFLLSLRSSESGRIAFPHLRFTGGGFTLSGDGAFDPAAQALTVNLDYQGGKTAAPLPGVTAAGALSIKGTLSRGGKASNLRISADDLTVNETNVVSLAVNAEGPASALRVSASAASVSIPDAPPIRDLSLAAVADISNDPHVDLRTFEADIAGDKAKLVASMAIALGEETVIEHLRAQWGPVAALSLDGAFSKTRWRADARLTGAPIPGADGLISFDLDLDTDRETPARGVFQAKSLLTRSADAEISGAMDWDGKRLRLKNANPDDAVDFDISLPVSLSRADGLSIKTDGAINGKARYAGELSAVAAYLPASLQSLEGALNLTAEVGGTLDAPSFSGSAEISNAAYTELRSGLSLVGLHAHAQAQEKDGATTIAFTAGGRGADQSGDDTITIDGAVTLAEASRIQAEAKLDKARLSAGPVNSVTASGAVTLSGPLDAVRASGAVAVAELNAELAAPKETGLVDIDVVTKNDTTKEASIAVPKPPLSFDVEIKADDRVFVRGRGLESEWRVDARATGDAEDPVILGTLSLRRGWFDFSGRRFTLTEGRLAFDKLVVNDPLITARAEHQTADGVTAIIVISGRASAPKIELQSSPALPAEDVMALVLFGKPAQELTALESLQAAQALAALSGVGPFGGPGVVGSLRQALRLDLLNLDVDPETGGGSLTVGKYVTSGLFVSATQDAQGENGAVRIQYEITNSIAIETEMKQDGEQTVSANWKKDF